MENNKNESNKTELIHNQFLKLKSQLMLKAMIFQTYPWDGVYVPSQRVPHTKNC